MSPGNESRNWVQEKISFTDSSSTDAISQGNAQMYGPIMVAEAEDVFMPIGKNITFTWGKNKMYRTES